jgi:hypothetical protein
MARVVLCVLWVPACGGSGPVTEADDDHAVGFVSDLTEVELMLAVQQSIEIAVDTDLRASWTALVNTLSMSNDSCPVMQGDSWSDMCSTEASSFNGFMSWQVNVDGPVSERVLSGDAVVGTETAVAFEFDGDGNDSYEDMGTQWIYQSDLAATVTGDLAFGAGSLTPGGFRTDMFVYYEGGSETYFEADGEVLLFDHLYLDRFDSVSIDLEFQGPLGADADDCTLEPRGLVSFRDSDAHWYDVVFEPKYQSNLDYDNDPYSACDGCGTVYYRGFEQADRVCLDFSFLWDRVLTQPNPSDFAI